MIHFRSRPPIPFLAAQSLADKALAIGLSTPRHVDYNIAITEQMAALAVDTAICRPSSANVLRVRDWLQVMWIDAKRYLARVVQFKAIGNSAAGVFIGYDMGKGVDSESIDDAVAFVVEGSHKEPTPRHWLHRNMAQYSIYRRYSRSCVFTFWHVTPFSRMTNGPRDVASVVAAFLDSTRFSQKTKEILHA